MDRSKTLEQRAMSWCFENDFTIDVLPVRQGKRPPVTLNVLKRGKIIKEGAKEYVQDQKLATTINNIYIHLYKYYTDFKNI
jgi:hypothetical protein